ncbi:hypothetical protein CWATWH0401_771 [Crocosphaera watsonii WH 0401]|uniref:Uncharacterized protein n=1 Tax=Crocosphaera watsonii WH 0401 TaxID=555881 RepID=T2JFL0_CROWT|nr:hypothetical protein CWATWH0401_771 [Crocosphaera watsonii WH 0401]
MLGFVPQPNLRYSLTLFPNLIPQPYSPTIFPNHIPQP